MLETQSIVLHHDAITGTHRRRVGNDYKRMMANIRQDSEKGAKMTTQEGAMAGSIEELARIHGL